MTSALYNPFFGFLLSFFFLVWDIFVIIITLQILMLQCTAGGKGKKGGKGKGGGPSIRIYGGHMRFFHNFPVVMILQTRQEIAQSVFFLTKCFEDAEGHLEISPASTWMAYQNPQDLVARTGGFLDQTGIRHWWSEKRQRFGARWWESSPTKVVFPHIWCFSTTAVWGHGQHGHDGTTAGNDARQQKQTKCMVLNRCVFVCVYPVKVLVFERWPHCWFQFLDGLNPTRGIYYVNLCQAC